MDSDDVKASEVFADEKTLGAIYVLHMIVGIAAFFLIFLIGWLGLGFFWSSMLMGIVVVLYVFKRMLNISMAKNAHDKFIKEVREEAEEMGIDGDKAEANAKIALDAIENASRS